MKHYFNLSRPATSPADSTITKRKHVDLGRLSYSFEYFRQTQDYTDSDPDSGFYRQILLDSTQTYDSLTIKKIINEITWTNPSFRPDKKVRLLQLEAGIKQQYVEVILHGKKNYFLQYIPSAGLIFNPLPQLHLDAHGDYVLGDYNKDDLSLKANLALTLGKADKNAGVVTFKALYSLHKPGWFYENYSGNNFSGIQHGKNKAWFRVVLIILLKPSMRE